MREQTALATQSPVVLDRSRSRHGILPVTGRCYGCGRQLKYLDRGHGKKQKRYYCSLECCRKRPPKMVLAEMAWGEPFEVLALRHLNEGKTVEALADMCGVHKQAIYQWLNRLGIERRVIWCKKGATGTDALAI